MHQERMKFSQNPAKWFTEQPPVSFLAIVNQTKMIPAAVCPCNLLEAPLSLLLSHSWSSRNKSTVFFPQNCSFMRSMRGLHIARSLSSTNLILITCGHVTAVLSNQTEHMIEFSQSSSRSINMKFMSAWGEWMMSDLSQIQAV